MSVSFSWFAALCDDDYEYLGVSNPDLVSSYTHCRDIVLEAQRQGFDNVLLPAGYELGIDALTFAAAMAPQVDRMNLLVAIRAGEMWPPQLARQLATLNQILQGRLTMNIISSDLVGAPLESEPRYQRTGEVMTILRALLEGHSIDHDGDHYQLNVDAPRMCREQPAQILQYFGGLSEAARETAARHSDVFLMWPDTEEVVASVIDDLRSRARRYGRTLEFGYRVHVVVRDSQREARAAADQLVSRLDAQVGQEIKNRSLDPNSAGVARQDALRDLSTCDGYVEPNLWTGIGRARSGCGAALVGTPEQIIDKLNRYVRLGISHFILSGYPHIDECRRFGETVLPQARLAVR